MSWFDACVLGAVQGLTEFVPVSSSGHLIFIREVLGLSASAGDLAFDAVLQLATAFAVLVYFRRDLVALARSLVAWLSRHVVEQEQKTLFLSIAVGTVPAIFAGLLLETSMETVFRSPTLVAWMLIAGAVLMFVADRFARQNRTLTVGRGLAVGFFQTLALVPGVSRSGATISGGLFAGLTREHAARFSFLLSAPILLGSGAKKLIDLWFSGKLASEWLPLFFGSVIAFTSGVLAIHFLISYLKRRDMSVFVYYRIALALLILLSLS